MNCCSECFSSAYLKDIINTNANIGNCDFCGSNNVNVYSPGEFNLIFQNILDLYTVNNDGQLIENQIEADFSNKIFSKKVEASRKGLLQEIVKDDYNLYKDIFTNNVVNKTKNPENLELIKPISGTWEKLADEIKYTNRFHLQNVLDLDHLAKLLRRYKKPITRGKKYYRARISDSVGFPIEQMGNPPSDKAKSGRANPVGISYLYLSDHEITTLYETRASLYDFVTIGEFRLKEDIEVINLRGDTYDPILLAANEELEEFLIYQPFTSKLEEQLSRPKRRSDNELDYLPTQYLSELIKSIGFAGVEFQSSLYEDGFNLAIFIPDKFECFSVKVCEIKKINILHETI